MACMKLPDASFALNRPLKEDGVEVLSDGTLEQVLNGLNYTRIDDKAGSTMALASEVWRTFLILMIIALMAEALLCVPEKAHEDVRGETIKRDTTGRDHSVPEERCSDENVTGVVDNNSAYWPRDRPSRYAIPWRYQSARSEQ